MLATASAIYSSVSGMLPHPIIPALPTGSDTGGMLPGQDTDGRRHIMLKLMVQPTVGTSAAAAAAL